MGVVFVIILGKRLLFVFKHLFLQESLLNLGTLIGIGVGGCVGVLGFVWKHWDGDTGIAACLMAGFIGGEMNMFEDGLRGQQNRGRKELMSAFELRGSGYLKAGGQVGRAIEVRTTAALRRLNKITEKHLWRFTNESEGPRE